MPVPSPAHDPLRFANGLTPLLSTLGDPELLAEVLDANPAGVVLVVADPDLTVAYCNDSFQRWAPLGGRPAIGRSLTDLFVRRDRNAIGAAYREVILTGASVHWRAAPYHPSSELGRESGVGYWNASHFPVRGRSGGVTHVLSFTVDVTDEVRARVRIGDAQQRVLGALGGISRNLTGDGQAQAFFANLSATIAELVSARRVVFWRCDSGSETLTPQAGAFGFAPGEVERLDVAFEDTVMRDSNAVTIPCRTTGRRLGAVGVYGSTRGSGFTDEDVAVMQAAVAAAALVWEHRQADEALAELHDREAASLRRQIEHSIQLEQAKTDFLKLASHELRAPLGIVRGYISMMEDGTLGPVDQEVGAVLPLLRAKLEDMNRLVNDMLETARLEDSALELRVVPVDMRDVVHDAVRSLEPLADERHRLTTSMPGRPVIVMGDPSRLGTVVTNLVHNALKYSPRGGEVRITCTAGDDQAEVAVSDQGIGIAPADLGSLFSRFGRIVTPETAGIAGTGLGLYLARALARRHGGDVRAESEPGTGSTFTLTLPLAPEQ